MQERFEQGEPWAAEWSAAQSELLGYTAQLEAAREEVGYRVLRVNQTDAAYLDSELMQLLQTQLKKIFVFFSYNVVERFRPEMDAFFFLLVYRFTIHMDRPTPGSKLQGLTYTNGLQFRLSDGQNDVVRPLQRWQKAGYALLSIGGGWAWSRLGRVATARNWSEEPESDVRHQVWIAMQRLETVYKALTLANLLHFLSGGRYRSVVERLLGMLLASLRCTVQWLRIDKRHAAGMQLMYINRQTYRAISFEYLNRQEVWSGFAEMLLFVLPLLNLKKLKEFALSLSGSPPPASHLHENACPICESSPPCTPYRAIPCSHIHCAPPRPVHPRSLPLCLQLRGTCHLHALCNISLLTHCPDWLCDAPCSMQTR